MKPIATGYVISVGRRYFWARLRTAAGEECEAKIDMRQLRPWERGLVAEGAYLWMLKSGAIRFSRKRWKKKEIEEAKVIAAELLKMLFP